MQINGKCHSGTNLTLYLKARTLFGDDSHAGGYAGSSSLDYRAEQRYKYLVM
jgi:hypothetical protein